MITDDTLIHYKMLGRISILMINSKAKIYGIHLSEVPSLHMQYTHFKRLLDEGEKQKLKRIFTKADIESYEPQQST